MSRAVLLAAAAALVTGGPAWAAPRDGVVEQQLVNTLGAHMQRRGYSGSDPLFAQTIARFKERQQAAVLAGCSASNITDCANGPTTWQQVLKGLGSLIPWPLKVGKDGQTIPSSDWGFGNGGASGTWTFDCSSLDLDFGADGSLIIPSYPLPMNVEQITPYQDGWSSKLFSSPSRWFSKSEGGAAVRRALHVANLGRDKRRWYGVIGPHPTVANAFDAATIAYRDGAGVLVPREAAVLGAQYFSTIYPVTPGDPPCPQTVQAGGTFHFYGEGLNSQSMTGCVHYAPNYDLSPDGYAINPQTSIPWSKNGWPGYLPEPYKTCLLDPSFVKRVTEALYKQASEQPGYDGVPHSPIQDQDVRTGDAKVDDLGDNPATGNSPTPDDGVNDPPPSPSDPTPTGGGDECDFGATGCTDPGTDAPTLEDPPTGIMDPIFEWLPDLPSITLPDMSASCPVWNINLTEFGGPSWMFLLDDHCTLMEYDAGHGSLRTILGNLMIAIFGIGAAMIILRA